MSTKTLINFSHHRGIIFSRYYVEEFGSGRWRRIPNNAGPYTSQAAAAAVAQKYSSDHNVRTRVVGVE